MQLSIRLDNALALHSLAGYSIRWHQALAKSLGDNKTWRLRPFPAAALYCKALQDIPPDRGRNGVPRRGSLTAPTDGRPGCGRLPSPDWRCGCRSLSCSDPGAPATSGPSGCRGHPPEDTSQSSAGGYGNPSVWVRSPPAVYPSSAGSRQVSSDPLNFQATNLPRDGGGPSERPVIGEGGWLRGFGRPVFEGHTALASRPPFPFRGPPRTHPRTRRRPQNRRS
jgi:hypothetical protein